MIRPSFAGRVVGEGYRQNLLEVVGVVVLEGQLQVFFGKRVCFAGACEEL
jgi:hypothetical protein